MCTHRRRTRPPAGQGRRDDSTRALSSRHSAACRVHRSLHSARVCGKLVPDGGQSVSLSAPRPRPPPPTRDAPDSWRAGLQRRRRDTANGRRHHAQRWPAAPCGLGHQQKAHKCPLPRSAQGRCSVQQPASGIPCLALALAHALLSPLWPFCACSVLPGGELGQTGDAHRASYYHHLLAPTHHAALLATSPNSPRLHHHLRPPCAYPPRRHLPEPLLFLLASPAPLLSARPTML